MLFLFATCFLLISCLACSLTLKMEVTCFSEMLVDFQQTAKHNRSLKVTGQELVFMVHPLYIQQTAWHYIPGERALKKKKKKKRQKERYSKSVNYLA
jgi:hypothetical protein